MTNYTVIYRTGGPERFEWRQCSPVSTFAEAASLKDSIVRGGRRALIHRTSQLVAIGLPTTWE